MRSIANILIRIYLIPLALSSRLAIYVKGLILRHNEHYVVALDVIRRDFKNQSGIIVDIGAFDGDSTLYLAKRLPGNSVLGFEPNPDPYKRGLDQTKKFKNVGFFNLGFSDKTGSSSLYVTENQVSSSLYDIKDLPDSSLQKVINVEVTTLDVYFKDYTDILLLKLDVQGSELSIFKMGTETLKKTKLILTEVLITEIYHGGCLYYELDEFLRKQGFMIHTICSNYNFEGTKCLDILYKRA
jgi:FkbM family methyltransferase